METIYVCVVGMTPFGRYPDKSIKQLTSEAVNAALQDANGQIADVEAAYFSARLPCSAVVDRAFSSSSRCSRAFARLT